MSKLFQASTYLALINGNYDYTMSMEYFIKNGDTGIGSYNGLNGEAIFLDGVCYNGTASGYIKVMDRPETGITFGQITTFNNDVASTNLKELHDYSIDRSHFDTLLFKGKNFFYVVKAEGLFSTMLVRANFKQKKPFKPLNEALKDQRLFNYENIEGTLIGFYTPEYASNISQAGWHFHFISKDRTKGGHVLNMSFKFLDCKVNLLDKFEVKLPSSKEFCQSEFKQKSRPDIMDYSIEVEKSQN